MGLIIIIECILIAYAICLTRKPQVELKTPQESPDDQTIQIPRNMPNFTVTVKNDNNEEEFSLELSEGYFLAMEKKLTTFE